jgi:hypothetical protein
MHMSSIAAADCVAAAPIIPVCDCAALPAEQDQLARELDQRRHLHSCHGQICSLVSQTTGRAASWSADTAIADHLLPKVHPDVVLLADLCLHR